MSGLMFRRIEHDCIFLAAIIVILAVMLWVCASRCGG